MEVNHIRAAPSKQVAVDREMGEYKGPRAHYAVFVEFQLPQQAVSRRIEITLHEGVAPLACESIRSLCAGTRGMRPYKGSIVTHIDPGTFFVFGGRPGLPLATAYGPFFTALEGLRTPPTGLRAGDVGVALIAPGEASAEVVICARDAPHLVAHAAVGRVDVGMDVVAAICALPHDPLPSVVVTASGELRSRLRQPREIAALDALVARERLRVRELVAARDREALSADAAAPLPDVAPPAAAAPNPEWDDPTPQPPPPPADAEAPGASGEGEPAAPKADGEAAKGDGAPTPPPPANTGAAATTNGAAAVKRPAAVAAGPTRPVARGKVVVAGAGKMRRVM